MPLTPFVVVDPAVLDRNVAATQAFADSRGIALRPHAKTHKSVDVARRQLAAGAVGLTVATLGEAEVFADLLAEHDRDVLVAYPVRPDVDRLRALAARVRVVVGVDALAGVEAAAAAGVAVSVEVDPGLHRTGVAPELAGELAAAARERGVEVVGVFTFPGHGYAPGTGASAAADEARALRTAGESLAAAGVEAPVRSGGCTPTFAHTDAGVVTELRPGVTVYFDAQQVALGVATLEQVALSITATVVSDAVPGQVVLDAGAKVLGMDRPAYVDGHGLLPDFPAARIERIWEHHGVVTIPPGTPAPAVGDRVRVVPNHVCSTVNLVDEVVVGDEVWPVSTRGRNT
ncbi:alanine racemase [Jatrophihabitans sp. YIM 134969]